MREQVDWSRYLKEMAILVGKSFNEMRKEDVGRFLQALEKRFPEEWTFVDCKTMFKTFFRFYMDEIADGPERRDETSSGASLVTRPRTYLKNP